MAERATIVPIFTLCCGLTSYQEMVSSPVIQSLWVGPELSIMEQLCICSFLAHGHTYHLYVYDTVNVQTVPPGTLLRDADEILPASMIFQYTQHKSYAGFSNFFRYKLLLEKGGWWVDTDFVCLRPFGFATDYVFASECVSGQETITSGVIKAPAGSSLMAEAWQICQTKKPQDLRWGETGPKLVAAAVERFSAANYVRPSRTFCPIGYGDWERVLDPTVAWEFDEQTYAVHLWNEMWRRAERDKNHAYHPDCLYERLKRQYLKPEH